MDSAIRENAADAAGFTALHLLAKPRQQWSSGQLSDVLGLAEALLKHGASVNPRVLHSGRTSLGLAASSGQEAMVRLLVRYGACPEDKEGNDGQTPIEICRKGRQYGMAKLLAELASSRAARSKRRRHR